MKKSVFSLLLVFLTNVMFSQDSYFNTEESDISFSKSILELNDNYTIISTGINSKLSEIGSTFFMDKYIMYSSRKTGAIAAGKDENTNDPYNALYCLNMDKTGNLSKPYFFASILDSKGNEGGLTFSPDQKTIYYTKSKEGNSKNYQLYKSVFDEECKCTWIEEASVVFNNESYSIENPSISPDGKKMYFSSNMPGGFGGFDIYIAEINADGMPVNPKNAGSTINTSEDEKFPYLSPDKELFFSSNGHSGYGSLDVFVSRIKKNSFSTPLNLGKTINTSANEVAFILASKSRGYVTSDRNTSLGSFDIYRFELQKTPIVLQGKAVEKQSKIVLPNTKISLIDEDGQEVATQTSNEQGKYIFEVAPLENYSIVAQKEGYMNYSLPVVTNTENAISNVELDQKKAEITEAAIVIENIYFDFDKATIKNESTLSLNKILEVLVANPEMKIAINAHTDSRGSDKYNMVLSEKRALEAKKYLIKKGISKERIESKGYGETKSLSNCSINCTEMEFNTDRRVEFLILK